MATCMNSKAKKCDGCIKEWNMPYSICCLDNCGEMSVCIGCDKGIYSLDTKINNQKKGIDNEPETI